MIEVTSVFLFMVLWIVNNDPAYAICAMIVWGVDRVAKEIRALGESKTKKEEK